MPLEKYTSVGCYPLFYIVDGWQPLCHECAEESEEESEAAVNWETPNLYCDECDCRIESAYAEPDETTANTEEGGAG
jgi:hypothetical protein